MRRHSFTLLELLITIGIMVVLAGITIGGLKYASNRGDEAKTKAIMKEFEMALEKYKAEKGMYPIIKTAGKVNFDDNSWKKFVQGKYYEKQNSGKLEDALGIAFWYQCPGERNKEKYDLWTPGKDGKHGDGQKSGRSSTVIEYAGEEGSDDYTNWNND